MSPSRAQAACLAVLPAPEQVEDKDPTPAGIEGEVRRGAKAARRLVARY